MSFFSSVLKNTLSSASRGLVHGVIEVGRNKNTGGHDHRTNKGDDRTPSQKTGDRKPNRGKK